jgi:hypothetical protein
MDKKLPQVAIDYNRRQQNAVRWVHQNFNARHSDAERELAVKDAKHRYERTSADLAAIVRLARYLDMDDKEISNLLRENNVSPTEVSLVMKGGVPALQKWFDEKMAWEMKRWKLAGEKWSEVRR